MDMITGNIQSKDDEWNNNSEENIQKDIDFQRIEDQKEVSINEVSETHSQDNKKSSNVTNVLEENLHESNSESIENNLESDENHKFEIKNEFSTLSLEEILLKLETIVNSENPGAEYKNFIALKEMAFNEIAKEVNLKKVDFLAIEGNSEDNFDYVHPMQSKLNTLISIFRDKLGEFQQINEEEQKKNTEIRKEIIEKLKKLYTNSEVGTNFFKEIRMIKEAWRNAGQVPKSQFKLLNNDYFFHLNQFYKMLDLNKEYLELEYAHNLEKRKSIIQRAKELVQEDSIQKALNELQYLHKLWKEEAEPVSEEFRESTWLEFKEISNKIHERKTELNHQLEARQTANLEKKNEIIEQIKKLCNPADESKQHNHWQNAIKKVEILREEFVKIGSVPKKVSNQNWNDFKLALRNFNSSKNNFYKSLKNNQQHNLEEKLKLIEIAKANMDSTDWETTVPLFKKLQEDWKNIGHVPKNLTNKVWSDFRETCNHFFNNYRIKNTETGDNWNENFIHKKNLLEELRSITEDDDSKERIEIIKEKWNNIGKVPRDKIAINSEFNKLLKEKLKLNKISDFELKDGVQSNHKLTDKARKLKSQIADLEAEITKLENNLGFFQKPSRDNPLLKETYQVIDQKKAQLNALKDSLQQIITNE